MASTVGNLRVLMSLDRSNYSKELVAAQREGQSAASALGGMFDAAGGAMMNAARVGVAAMGALTAGAVAYAVANSQNYVKAQQFENALYLVANQMGYTNEQIQDQIRGMQAMGASTTTAQNTIMGLMRSRLDATKATELYARAEDIAVTSGRTGQEVIEGLIHGITTQNALVLRNAGVTIDSDKALRDYAATVGKSVSALSAQEKQQAYMNAVLNETANIAGVASRMMQEGVFNWQALAAPMNEVALVAGSLVEPAMTLVGRAVFQLAWAFIEATREGGALRPIIDVIRDAMRQLGEPIAAAINAIRDWIRSLDRAQVQDFAEALKDWLPVIGAVAGALISFSSGTISQALGPIGALVPSINPVVGAFLGLLALDPQMRAMFGGLLQQLMSLVPYIASAMAPVLQALVNLFRAVLGALMPLLPALVSLLTAGLQAVVPVLALFANGLAAVIGWLTPLLNGVANLLIWLQPVMPLILAVVGGLWAWSAVQGVLGPLMAAMGPIMAAFSGGLTLSGIATNFLAVAQWALNAALLANPITWIVIGIAALVAALILAYNKSETFRNVVNGIWDALKAVGGFIASVFKPVLDFLGAAIGFVIEHWKAFAMVLLIVTGPIGWVTAGIIWLVTHLDMVGDAVGRVIGWLADRLGPVFTWLWQNVLGPFVSFLGAVFGPAFQWIADNILPTFVGAFQAHIQMLASVFGFIGELVHRVVDFFQWLFDMLIGGSIIPNLVNGIIGWFASLPGAVIGAISNFVGTVVNGIASGLGWVLGWVGGWLSGLGSLIFSGLAWVGGLAATAIQTLVSAVVGALSWLGSWAGGWLSGLGSLFWSGIAWIAGIASTLFWEAVNAVVGALSWLGSWAGGWLSGLGSSFWAGFGWIVSTVASFVTTLVSTVMSWLSWLGAWASSWLSSLGSIFWSGWNGIWSTVTTFIVNIYNTVVSWLAFLGAWATSWQSTLGSMFWAGWNWIWGSITTFVTNIFNTVWSWFTNLFAFLWQNAENTKAMLSDAWTWLWTRAGEIWGAMWGTITGWANAVWSSVTNTFYSLRDTVASILEQMVAWGAQRLNWVIDRINDFIGLVNSGLDKFGIPAMPTVGRIPGYAQGGVFDPMGLMQRPGSRGLPRAPGITSRPTMFVAGEENRPESIIPWNPAYRRRALDLWELTGDKLGFLDKLKEQLMSGLNIGGPGGSQGNWWDGNFPMTQGPGGGFSHGNLNAWDYSMPNGTPIKMGLPGVVVPGPGGGYGVSLGVNLDQGGSVILGHLQSVVKTGRADVGELIAYSDNTGFSTGPHMHIEFRNTTLSPGEGGGGSVDIMAMIRAWAEEILKTHEPNEGAAPAWGFAAAPRPLTAFNGLLRSNLLGNVNWVKAIAEWIIKNFSSKIRGILGLSESGERGTITQEQLWQMMDQIGFGAPKDWAARVVRCESGFNCSIVGPQWNGDGGSIGLWQIQPGAHPSADRDKLKDCLYNTQWAKRLYDERGPAPWSCKALGDIIGRPELSLFDRGGMMVGPGPIPYNASGEPEMVLNQRTYTRMLEVLERIESALQRTPGPGPVTFNQEFNDVGTTAQEVTSDVLIALRTT